MTHPPVTVVIPTFNRPDGLTCAVNSLFAQSMAAQGFSILIVDNSVDGNAAEAIASLQQACPPGVTLTAIYEPNPGVANARNAAMSALDTKLIAFLDDDQSAPETWLQDLLDAYIARPVPVTFGPVRTKLPTSITRHRAYFKTFFAREPRHETGYIDASYGCGNALVDIARLPGRAPWFDTAMNETGGEDDMLFARIRRSSGKFAWAENAHVFEHPPANRLNLQYTLKRAFAYGQGPVSLALNAPQTRWLEVVKWMAVGLVKGTLHGLAWLFQLATNNPERAVQLDKSVRGFAKLIWFVDLRFYGQAALKTKPPKTAKVQAASCS